MDKLTDQAIQRLLDDERLSGLAKSLGHAEPLEMAAYRHLFDELDKDLLDGLPPDFSDHVVRQLQVRKNRLEETLFYILLSVGCVLAFGFGFRLFTILNANEVRMVLDSLSTSRGWFAFGLSLLFLFQILDQKLVKTPRLKDKIRL